MRVLVLVVSLAGCQRLLGFEDLAGPVEPPPAVTARCSTTHSFADAFDGPLHPFWSTSELVALENGALRFSFPSSDPVDVSTVPLLDIRGSSFSAEVITANVSNLSVVSFVLDAPEQVPSSALRRLELRLAGTTLEAVVRRGDAFMTVAQVSYDAIAHRFWRIAEADGVVSWSTSPDGTSYSELTRANVPDASMVRPRIEARRGDAPSNFELRIDNVNAGVELDPICLAESLQESFEGELDPYVWDFVDHATVSGGHVRLQSTDNTDGATASIHPGSLYDLQGAGITVEISKFDFSDPTSVVTVIAEPIGVEGFVAFQIRDKLVARADDGELASATYDEVAHRFLRLRADGDAVVWEVSADGVEFSLFAQTANRDLGTAMLLFDASAASSIDVEIAGVNAP